MKILNLFSGLGGNRDGWNNNHQITAVELNQHIAFLYWRRFPNDLVIIGDAYDYLIRHFKEFDFIWCSPPCKTHTRLNKFRLWRIEEKGYNEVIDLPDLRLYSLIIFLKENFKGYWIVENVVPYYKPLIRPTVRLGRHLIWSNFFIDKKKFEGKEYFNQIEKTALVKGIDLDMMREFRFNSFRIDGVLRDMVNPEISAYIIKCLENKVKLKQKQLSEI